MTSRVAPKDGTAYWTLSIYFTAEAVAERAGRPLVGPKEKARHVPLTATDFRDAQLEHENSSKLRRAVDPLFNDIANRERFGELENFLFATKEGPLRIKLRVNRRLEWTTEGKNFVCQLGDPTRPSDPPDEPSFFYRDLSVRRFWLAHSNGALSYHLTFEHDYGKRHDVETLYFLSLLQKLAAPKEYELRKGHPGKRGVFEPEHLGIMPLDGIDIVEGKAPRRFWHVVEDWLRTDSNDLFREVLEKKGSRPLSESAANTTFIDSTLEEMIEVPRLLVPRNRSLFFLHDSHFFERLLPAHLDEPMNRKDMVQDACFAPYREQLRRASTDDTVRIGRDPKSPEAPHIDWTWLEQRPEYGLLIAWGLRTGQPVFTADRDGKEGLASEGQMGAAAREKRCWQHVELVPLEPAEAYFVGKSADDDQMWCAFEALALKGPPGKDPVVVRLGKNAVWPPGDYVRTKQLRPIPAGPVRVSAGFTKHRTDCLDYLFLSGFNQNIIDWLNQEPSEILDSTDPIYPISQDAYREAFFVRFANQKSLITYVPSSRTLEVGRDYIGTCPYAFLIHILTFHNEVLVKQAELRVGQTMRDLDDLLAGGPKGPALRNAETMVSEMRRAIYLAYGRYRSANAFRYDTERNVFEELENIRGVARRKETLESTSNYISNLIHDLEARRARSLNGLLIVVGLIGFSSAFFELAEFSKEHQEAIWPLSLVNSLETFAQICEVVFANAGWVILAFLVVLLLRAKWRIALGDHIEGLANPTRPSSK